MTLEPFFRSIPLALPGVVVAAVVCGLAAPWLGRRLGIHPVLAWFAATVLGGYLALTMTPTSAALDGYKQGQTYFSAGVSLPSVASLTSASDVTLNIAAGLALGFASTLVATATRRWWPVVTAVTVPVLAELVQWAISAMGRSGFLLADVVQNWAGIALGAGLALAVRAILAHRHSPTESPRRAAPSN